MLLVLDDVHGQALHLSPARGAEMAVIQDLLSGLAQALPGFEYDRLKGVVDQEFAQLKQVLHGVSLLGQCPDSVNAAIICRGEKLSIAIMEGVFRAKGYPVTVINPVEKLLAQGHYLESTVDIAESTLRIAAAAIPAKRRTLIRERIEPSGTLAVRVYRRAGLHGPPWVVRN